MSIKLFVKANTNFYNIKSMTRAFLRDFRRIDFIVGNFIFTNLTSSSAVARCSTTVVAGTYLLNIGLTLFDPAFSVVAFLPKL
jgi:hypothetical protein